MKTLIFLLLLTLSFESVAKLNNCYKEISQAEKNECMTFEKDHAIGKLMTKITLECSEKDEIRESKGGSIYAMLIDECMAWEITKIIRHYPEELSKD